MTERDDRNGSGRAEEDRLPPVPAAPLAAAAIGLPREVKILLPLLTLFWGVNWPIMKVGLEAFDVLTFRVLTIGAGAVGFFAIAALRRRTMRPTARDWRGILPTALLNVTAWNLFILYGVSELASGRAAILGYTMPLWATLFSVVVAGARLSGRQIAGLACGLAGMLLLVVEDFGAMGAAPLGTLSCIFAAMCWGAGTVYIRHYGFSLGTAALTGWLQLLGVMPVLVLAAFWADTDWGAVGLWPGLAMLYNMTIASVFCYWAWFRIATLVPVVVSTVSTLIIPALGVFSGMVVLGEQPGVFEFAALALVAAAVAAVALPKRR